MGQAARGGSPTEMRLMLQVQLLPPRADLFLERGDVSAVPPKADRQLYDPRIFGSLSEPNIDGGGQAAGIKTSKSITAHRNPMPIARLTPPKPRAHCGLGRSGTQRDWFLGAPVPALGRMRAKSAGMTESASALY
jgi:hypothetical protein